MRAAMRVTQLVLIAAIFVGATSADAKPVRSAAVVLAFKRHNPCPSNGLRQGACSGYQVDHVMSLCAGGADKGEHAMAVSGSASHKDSSGYASVPILKKNLGKLMAQK